MNTTLKIKIKTRFNLVEIEGQRHYFPKRFSEPDRRFSGLDRYGHAVGLRAKGWGYGNVNGAAAKLLRPSDSSSLPFPSPFLGDKVGRGKTMKKKPEVKEKQKKFILVNDMEMELDDSEFESEEDAALWGSTTSTASTGITRETTTTTTTKTTTTTTGSSSGSPSSPRNGIMAPAPIKSALGGFRLPPPFTLSASASLITPPTTPPSEPISRYGSHANIVQQ